MLLTLSYWPNLGRNWRASRKEPKPQLTDEQWLLIADLFPVRRMKKSRRASLRATTPVPGGNPLGVNQWCTLERFTNILPLASDLLAAASRVDPKRNLPDRLAPTAPPARRNEVAPLGRGDGRRHVYPAKKGGFVSARRSAARGRRSCSSSTAAARRSASTSPVPVRRKSTSLSRS